MRVIPGGEDLYILQILYNGAMQCAAKIFLHCGSAWERGSRARGQVVGEPYLHDGFHGSRYMLRLWYRPRKLCALFFFLLQTDVVKQRAVSSTSV
jgi:hypothetical protein